MHDESQGQETNPYQSPEASTEPQPPRIETGNLIGVFRSGKFLVMELGASLPARCIKSNERANRVVRQKVFWHPPLAYLALLGGIFPYFIIAAAMTKRATLHVVLSERWWRKKRRRTRITTGLYLAVPGSIVASVALGSNPDWIGAASILFLFSLLFLLAAIWSTSRGRLLRAKRFTESHVWIKGVSPEFLAELPPWSVPREEPHL